MAERPTLSIVWFHESETIREEESMPRSYNRSRRNRSDWGVMEVARERPIAAAAAAAGAAAAGLFLWSKRNQISHQINNLSDQIGEWTDSMTSGSANSSRSKDAAVLTDSRANMRSGAGSRSASDTITAPSRARGRARGTRKMAGTGSGQAPETSGLSVDHS